MDSQRWRHLGSLWPIVSADIDTVEALEAFVGPLDHRFLSCPDPDPGIVELLVWLVWTVRVANLALQVAFVLLVKSSQTIPVCPLSVCVDVHLHHTITHRFPNFCSRGPTATVHDEVEGLLLRALQLLPRKVLVPFQQVRGQHHVAGLIDAVDVSKSSSDGEHGADGEECLVDFENLLRCCVKCLCLNTTVVNAILSKHNWPREFCESMPYLLSSCDPNLHLQPQFHRCHPLEIFDTGGNVLFIKLFTEIKHV